MTDPGTPPSAPPTYPIVLDFVRGDEVARWRPLVNLLLAIPQFVVVYLLMIVERAFGILAVIALAVGIPLGVIVGRAAWSRFATEQGISSDPTVDAGAIALFVPAVILAAVIIAAIPARVAARVSPAIALRGE